MQRLKALLHQHFPAATIPDDDPELGVGSFPEWDSLGTFSFLMLVEQTYGIRFTTQDMADLKTLAAISARLTELGVEA
jgi:acyl carrier protein